MKKKPKTKKFTGRLIAKRRAMKRLLTKEELKFLKKPGKYEFSKYE